MDSYVLSFYLEALRECRHPNLRLRLRALETLYKEHIARVEPDFLLGLLRRASDYEEQSYILGMFSEMGARMPVGELITLLRDRSDANQVPRWNVAVALAALGAHAPVELFISLLQDPTEEVGLRETLAELLGQFGERVPLEVLLDAVADEEPGVCAAGIASLIVRGYEAPLEPILAQLGHPDEYVRKAAIRALSAAGERAPIEPIVAALADPDWQVREAAAAGLDSLLACFGERVPLAPLIAAVEDESASVRETALDTLANHPAYAPLDLAVRALDDPGPYVRCAALLVLERLGSERVSPDIHPKLEEMATLDPSNARKYAARALALLKGLPPPPEPDWFHVDGKEQEDFER
jgi:HEAT repeat protein